MSHIWIMPHIWMIHVTHTNASYASEFTCDTYEWISSLTYELWVSHMNYEAYKAFMRDTPAIHTLQLHHNASKSGKWMSHTTHMKGSCLTYECVMRQTFRPSSYATTHLNPANLPTYITGRRRLMGCLKLQVIFRKRATKCRARLQKMTCEDKASYDSTPPCRSSSHGTTICVVEAVLKAQPYVWHDECLCATWGVWHDGFIGETWHVYIMTHMWMNHVSHMNASCVSHPHPPVTPQRIQIRQITPTREPRVDRGAEIGSGG